MTAPLWWRVAYVTSAGRVSWLSGYNLSWTGYVENACQFRTEIGAAEVAARWVAAREDGELPGGPLSEEEKGRLFVVPFQAMAEDARRAGWRTYRAVLGEGWREYLGRWVEPDRG